MKTANEKLADVIVLDKDRIQANKEKIKENKADIKENRDKIQNNEVKTGKTEARIECIMWILGICLPLILTAVVGIPVYIHSDMKVSLHNNMNDMKVSLHNNMNALKTTIENLEKHLIEKINKNASNIYKINKYGKIKPDYEKVPWKRVPEKNENIDRGPSSVGRIASQPSFTTDSVPDSISGLASQPPFTTDKEPASVGRIASQPDLSEE